MRLKKAEDKKAAPPAAEAAAASSSADGAADAKTGDTPADAKSTTEGEPATVSLFGVGGVALKAGEEKRGGKRRTPGEIRIQKGTLPIPVDIKYIIVCKLTFVYYFDGWESCV